MIDIEDTAGKEMFESIVRNIIMHTAFEIFYDDLDNNWLNFRQRITMDGE